MSRTGRIAGLAFAVLLGLTLGCSRPAAPAGTDWQAEGPIEAMDGRTWVVGTQLVTVAPDAAVVGTPTVGASVKLIGTRDQTGSLVAHRVETIRQAEPTAPPPPPAVQPEAKPTAPPAAKPATKPAAPAPPKAKPRGDDDDD